MSKKIIIIAILLVVALVGAAIFGRSRVKLTIDPDSTVQTINVSVNGGSLQPLPATVHLRFGKHQLVFSGPGAEIWEQPVRVWPPFPRTIPITLGEPELPGIEKYLENPYLGFFPREADDYRIEATTASENNEVKIIKLTIIAIHHFEGPQDGQAYIDERDIAVNAAKKWLKDNGVPDSIPIEVTDE